MQTRIRYAALVALALLLSASPAAAQDRPLTAALGSYLTLSVIDAHQTGTCLAAGTCKEVNPMLRPFAAKPSALVTAKLAANTGVAVAVWKLRKRHPKAALALAIVSVGSQALVVRQNARRR